LNQESKKTTAIPALTGICCGSFFSDKQKCTIPPQNI